MSSHIGALLVAAAQQSSSQEYMAELAKLRLQMRYRREDSEKFDVRLKKLEEENDELRLYLAAIVRLLVTKGLVSRDEVLNFVEAIDAEDGAADGKFDGPIA